MYEKINRGCFNPGGNGGGAGSFVPISGGIMTGPLTLSGDPTTALEASTKQYTDAGDAANAAAAAAAAATANAALPKAGGVMTGNIQLPGGGPVLPQEATDKAYVDAGDAAVAAAAPSGPYVQTPGLVPVAGYVTLNIPGIGVVKFTYTI